MKVLYVDDDAEDFLLVARMLARHDITVIEAATYDEALVAPEVDVCLLDYRLGDRNGLELLTEMLLRRPNCAAILMTGQDDRALDAAAMAAGAAAFLVKGRFDGALLERTIRYAVAQKKSATTLALRALSEQAPRAHEGQYRAIFGALDDGLVILDDNDCIVDANAAACALFIRSHDRLIGSRLVDLMGEPRANSGERPFSAGAPKGRTTVTRGDLTARDVEWTFVPQFLAGRSLVSLRTRSTDGIDSTERDGAVQSGRGFDAMARLAGGVAHGFNNMLAVICGHVEVLLSRADLDDLTRLNLCEVQEATERSKVLSRQLLGFSRQQIVETRILDVNEAVGKLHAEAQQGLRDGIVFEVDCAPLRPIKFDPLQFESIFVSLVDNAVHALARGGRLSVRTRSVRKCDAAAPYELAPPDASTHILLSVADNGIGMDGHTLDRIFEPFFTTRIDADGCGLGLAALNGMVQAADGDVKVESRLGAGTTVCVYLKCVEQKPCAPTATMPPARGRVILVDDEGQVRRVTALIMRQMGYEVIEATSGAHALEICAALDHHVDILVTDMIMPGMGGREVASALVAQRPDLKVLFLSGYSSDDLLRRGVADASVSFIQKPFQASELGDKLRDIMHDKVRSGVGQP